MAKCYFLKITFQDGSSYDYDKESHYEESEKYTFSRWIDDTLNQKEPERFLMIRNVSFRFSDIRYVEFIERFCPTQRNEDGTFEECPLTITAQIEREMERERNGEPAKDK